jgi:uncharacterized protein
METERPIPQPITPESKPYWDGMKEGKLMLPNCQDCGKAHFYPRVFCPHCHSNNLTWVQGSGKGKLYSFEILYRPFNRAVKVPPPYVLAMVELEEGPRMLSNLVNVEPDPKVIKCDMPVEIVFSKLTDDMTIPLFQPAR